MSAPREETSAHGPVKHDYLEIVGGDDPDFARLAEPAPLLCSVPGLKSLLPQCR